MSDYHAAKHDQGKKRYDLIPEICVRELLREKSKYVWARRFKKLVSGYEVKDWPLALLDVLMYGIEKYSEDSWKRVPNAQNRYWAASRRHEDAAGIDPESGLPHSSHVLCNVMFLLWFEIKEDRPELFKS